MAAQLGFLSRQSGQQQLLLDATNQVVVAEISVHSPASAPGSPVQAEQCIIVWSRRRVALSVHHITTTLELPSGAAVVVQSRHKAAPHELWADAPGSASSGRGRQLLLHAEPQFLSHATAAEPGAPGLLLEAEQQQKQLRQDETVTCCGEKKKSAPPSHHCQAGFGVAAWS